jgi:hypothetical protein
MSSPIVWSFILALVAAELVFLVRLVWLVIS